jgi:hypothetical protein
LFDSYCKDWYVPENILLRANWTVQCSYCGRETNKETGAEVKDRAIWTDVGQHFRVLPMGPPWAVPGRRPRLAITLCTNRFPKSADAVRASSRFVEALVLLQSYRDPQARPQALPKTPTPLSLRFNPARVQIRATVDLPRAAPRTFHVLADLGHRQVWRQWYGRGINVALAVTFPSIRKSVWVFALLGVLQQPKG